MADVVGRVELTVDADGAGLPAQVRRIGQEAGAEASQGFNQRFRQGARQGATQAGRDMGARLGPAGNRAGQNFANQFARGLRSRSGGIEDRLQAMTNLGFDTSNMDRFQTQVSSLAQSFDDVGRARQNDARAAQAQAVAAERANRAANTQAMRNFSNSLRQQARARQEAERAAAAAVRMQERERVSLDNLERQMARTFNNPNGVQNYARSFMSFDRAATNLNENLTRLRDNNRISNDEFERMSTHIRTVERDMGRMSSSTDRNNNSIRNLNGNLRHMPHLLKEIIGWTVAIAALSGPIAALGSVAGSSIVVLAAAVAALGAGAIVAIAGFKGMLGDLAEVAPAARPAAKALQDMGKEFGKLQDFLQGRMFDGLGPKIQAMAASIMPALRAGLGPVADVLNNLMGQIAGALATPEGAAELKNLLAGFAPVLQGLGDGFLQFGASLSAILTAAQPMAQAFGQAFADAGRQFNEFLRSAEGQQALTDFFGTLQTLMPTIIDLVAAAGQTLARLVTPETVASLDLALQAFVQFMPVLGDLLNAISELNAFGIVAELFRILGATLEPLMGPLTTIAETIGSVLVTALQALAPAFGEIMAAVAPFLDVVAEMVSTLLPPLVEMLTPLIGVVVQLAQGVLAALFPAFQALLPVLQTLITAFQPILDVIVLIAQELVAQLTPFISQLADVFVSLMETLAPIIAEILPLLAELLMAVWEAISPLIPVVLDLVKAFLPLLEPILKLVAELLPPLIDLVTVLVDEAFKPLIGMIAEIVKSFIPLISTIVDSVIPLIEDLTKILKGLIDFVTGVFTGDWDRAWSGIKDIFSGVWDLIVDAATGALDIIVGAINAAIDLINKLLNKINSLTGLKIPSIPSIPSLPKTAIGGTFNGAQARIIGEAGPEAVVPLNRPLSQVHPSVRQLSAFAQGKGTADEGGGGKRVVFTGDMRFEAPNTDPELAAESWADKVIEKIG